MSPYDKADKPSLGRAGGEYVKISKENKFDSGLFKAACIVMVLGWPWVAFALAIWGVPGTWEMTLYDLSLIHI